MNGLYRKYLLFKSKVGIFVEDIKINTKIPFKTRMKCLNKGFLSRSYYLYDLKNNSYKLYISDYDRKKTRFINGENSIVLNDKLIFSNIIDKYIDTPKIYSVILNGKIYSYSSEIVIDNNAKLIEEIKKQGFIVIKPCKGAKGEGVYICKYKDGNIYFNDILIKEKDIGILIDRLDQYIITEYIEQHNYSSEIYSGSVNTMRIITMRDPYTQEIFIPIAVHRLGTSITNNVDNFDKGGLTSEIYIDTGQLSKATRKPINSNEMKWYSNHPDTNAKIEGTIVPKWDLIKEKVVLAAKQMPFLRYIGWDIVLTKDGKILVLEANNHSGMNVLQVHKPLLADDRVKKFYKYYNII